MRLTVSSVRLLETGFERERERERRGLTDSQTSDCGKRKRTVKGDRQSGAEVWTACLSTNRQAWAHS